MSSHHTRLAAVLCVLATSWIYGCDDNGDANDRANRIAPSPISFNGFLEPAGSSSGTFSRGVTLQRDTVTPQLVAGRACPAGPRFQASFGIIASGDDQSDAFLSEVQMRFVDRTGRIGSSMAIAHTQLLQRIGSTRIPRSGRRVFAFTFPFGCVGHPTGTLAVDVVTRDPSGRDLRTSLSLGIH
jgi:hypothetical protein